MVGRSGSSAGALPVCFVEAVVEVSPLSGVRRFMVGRSGSSAGVDVVLVVEPESGVVPDDVPELVVSGLRRFMVGRSASSLVAGLAVPDAEVSGLPVGCVVDWVGVDLLWSLPLAVVESAPGLVTRCGRLGSGVAVMTGTVFEALRAAVVFLGAASGLTLP
jgi:hypothetical protein